MPLVSWWFRILCPVPSGGQSKARRSKVQSRDCQASDVGPWTRAFNPVPSGQQTKGTAYCVRGSLIRPGIRKCFFNTKTPRHQGRPNSGDLHFLGVLGALVVNNPPLLFASIPSHFPAELTYRFPSVFSVKQRVPSHGQSKARRSKVQRDCQASDVGPWTRDLGLVHSIPSRFSGQRDGRFPRAFLGETACPVPARSPKSRVQSQAAGSRIRGHLIE